MRAITSAGTRAPKDLPVPVPASITAMCSPRPPPPSFGSLPAAKPECSRQRRPSRVGDALVLNPAMPSRSAFMHCRTRSFVGVGQHRSRLRVNPARSSHRVALVRLVLRGLTAPHGVGQGRNDVNDKGLGPTIEPMSRYVFLNSEAQDVKVLAAARRLRVARATVVSRWPARCC